MIKTSIYNERNILDDFPIEEIREQFIQQMLVLSNDNFVWKYFIPVIALALDITDIILAIAPSVGK